MSKNANKAALDEIVATTPTADNAPAVEEASAAVEPPAKDVEPPAKDDPREYVEFKLPRDPRSKENGKYVSVNEISVFVPFGKRVKIPRCIKEVLENSIDEDERTQNRLLALQEEARTSEPV